METVSFLGKEPGSERYNLQIQEVFCGQGRVLQRQVINISATSSFGKF